MRVHIVCEKHLSVRARRKSWSARLWVSCAELAELSAVHAVRRMEVVEARALAPQQQETAAGTAAAAEDGSTLYGPLELFTSVRRRNQIILLRDHM